MAFFIKPGRPGLFRKEDNTLRQSGPIYLQDDCGHPRMAAGVTSKLWDMSDMVNVPEEWERANA